MLQIEPTADRKQHAVREGRPLDGLWQTRAIVWMVLSGEALAIVLSLAPGGEARRWIYFGLTSVGIQWISLLTLGWLYLLREPLSRWKPQHVAYLALAALLVNTWFVGGVARVFLIGTWPLAQDSWPALFLRWTGIALAVGLLGLAAFQTHWRNRQLAVRAKQAELESLRARIRPHFLFNTLNTAAALVHQRPRDAEQILLDLADLFRAALSGPREVSLEEELALTRRYVEIESLRFSDRLLVRWNVPDPVPAAMVPTLSIQPLVENAIRHGVEQTPGRSTVEIEIEQRGDIVSVTVRNDLPPGGASSATGHRVGQASTRARIEALTGENGRLETTVKDGRYVATITLPQGKMERG